MPLQVGIDAWNLPGDKRGIGRYVREIVRRWAAWDPAKIQPSLLVPEWATLLVRRRYLMELGVSLPVRHRMAEAGMDVIWYPWNGVSWIAKTPIVATLHDASRFRLAPRDAGAREREQRPFFEAARRTRRILTDSHFSKAELVRYLNIDPAKIDVIYLGVNEAFRPADVSGPQSSGYLLFVGEPEPRKGLTTLLEAFKLLPPQLQSSLEIVVVGLRGEYEMPPIPEGIRVRTLGWVEDAQLANLYREAAALVYPSEYEGFGLPIIEAMAVGTVVIAADTQSSREAGGGAALYALPSDAHAFAETIACVLTQPELRTRLQQLGLKNVEERTWDRTADQTFAALELSAKSRNAR